MESFLLILALSSVFFLAVGHRKHKARGRLVVSGQDAVVIPLNFQPQTVTAHFTKASPQPMPSCLPPSRDRLSVEIATIENGPEVKYGIKITWKVSQMREIRWTAKGSSS
jgi:hypothetical protein